MIDLPKWPAMVVKGEPVTKEQAMEIIVRTGNIYFSCNDKEWNMFLNYIYYDLDDMYDDHFKGIAKELNVKETDTKVYEYISKKIKELGVLDLEYLRNERVASSWIGGPHGWCNWDGKIFSNNYNIGKYPTVEEVTEEWNKIAKAFPFLDLECVLYKGETSEEENEPLMQFTVKNGEVNVGKSTLVIKPRFLTDDILLDFHKPGRERGCSEIQIIKAINHTKSVVNV